MFWNKTKQTETQQERDITTVAPEFGYVNQMIEVGKTTVLVRFREDFTMNMTFYGNNIDIWGVINNSITSLERYQTYMNGISGRLTTHWNDEINPTESFTGTILHTKVIDTSPFMRECIVKVLKK